MELLAWSMSACSRRPGRECAGVIPLSERIAVIIDIISLSSAGRPARRA